MSGTKGIEVLMAENRTFPPSKEFSKKAHIKSMEEYEKLYKRSVEDPDGFWAEMAEKIFHGIKSGIKFLNIILKNLR